MSYSRPRPPATSLGSDVSSGRRMVHSSSSYSRSVSDKKTPRRSIHQLSIKSPDSSTTDNDRPAFFGEGNSSSFSSLNTHEDGNSPRSYRESQTNSSSVTRNKLYDEKSRECYRRQKENTALVREEFQKSLRRVKTTMQRYRRSVERNTSSQTEEDEVSGIDEDAVAQQSSTNENTELKNENALSEALAQLQQGEAYERSQEEKDRERFRESVAKSKRDMHEVLTSRIAMQSTQARILQGLLRQVDRYRNAGTNEVSIRVSPEPHENEPTFRDIEKTTREQQKAKESLNKLYNLLLENVNQRDKSVEGTTHEVEDDSKLRRIADLEEELSEMKYSYNRVLESRDSLQNEVSALTARIHELSTSTTGKGKKRSKQSFTANRRNPHEILMLSTESNQAHFSIPAKESSKGFSSTLRRYTFHCDHIEASDNRSESGLGSKIGYSGAQEPTSKDTVEWKNVDGTTGQKVPKAWLANGSLSKSSHKGVHSILPQTYSQSRGLFSEAQRVACPTSMLSVESNLAPDRIETHLNSRNMQELSRTLLAENNVAANEISGHASGAKHMAGAKPLEEYFQTSLSRVTNLAMNAVRGMQLSSDQGDNAHEGEEVVSVPTAVDARYEENTSAADEWDNTHRKEEDVSIENQSDFAPPVGGNSGLPDEENTSTAVSKSFGSQAPDGIPMPFTSDGNSTTPVFDHKFGSGSAENCSTILDVHDTSATASHMAGPAEGCMPMTDPSNAVSEAFEDELTFSLSKRDTQVDSTDAEWGSLGAALGASLADSVTPSNSSGSPLNDHVERKQSSISATTTAMSAANAGSQSDFLATTSSGSYLNSIRAKTAPGKDVTPAAISARKKLVRLNIEDSELNDGTNSQGASSGTPSSRKAISPLSRPMAGGLDSSDSRALDDVASPSYSGSVELCFSHASHEKLNEEDANRLGINPNTQREIMAPRTRSHDVRRATPLGNEGVTGTRKVIVNQRFPSRNNRRERGTSTSNRVCGSA